MKKACKMKLGSIQLTFLEMHTLKTEQLCC